MILFWFLIIILFVLVVNEFIKILLSYKEGADDAAIQKATNTENIATALAKIQILEDNMDSMESSVNYNTGMIGSNTTMISSMC